MDLSQSSTYDGKQFFRDHVYGSKGDHYYYLTEKNYYFFSQTPGLDYVLNPRNTDYLQPDLNCYMGYIPYRSICPHAKRVAIVATGRQG